MARPQGPSNSQATSSCADRHCGASVAISLYNKKNTFLALRIWKQRRRGSRHLPVFRSLLCSQVFSKVVRLHPQDRRRLSPMQPPRPCRTMCALNSKQADLKQTMARMTINEARDDLVMAFTAAGIPLAKLEPLHPGFSEKAYHGSWLLRQGRPQLAAVLSSNNRASCCVHPF